MHSLPDLPYALDALSPLMSAETLRYHHGKHHKSYVKKTNELLQGTPLEGKPIEEVVKAAKGSLFDNAAQHYNHSFFWQCLTPGGTAAPKASLLQDITTRWGSLDLFKEDFGKKAKGLFGSGWCWLTVAAGGGLEVVPTPDAGTPIVGGAYPLLVVDVWEHAYYIDYRNSRKGYIDAFWKLADWDVAERRYRERPSA